MIEYDYYNIGLIIFGVIMVVISFTRMNYSINNDFDKYFSEKSECDIKSGIYIDNVFTSLYALLFYNISYYKNRLFRNILKITLIIHIVLDLIENQFLISIYDDWKTKNTIDKDRKYIYDIISTIKWIVAGLNVILVILSWYYV